MRLTASLLGRKIPLLATASAVATLGLVAIVPLTAQASTISSAHGYGIPWKLGTPLPTVPAGFMIQAEPNLEAMKGMKPGTQFNLIPVTLPASSSQADVASASAAATTALASDANSAGYVNFQVMPKTPDVCSQTFVGNQGSITTAVAQSYSTDAYDSQDFFYGTNQSSSITIGYSGTAAYGSFSDYGTTSVSGGGGDPFPQQNGKSNNYWRTQFEWGLWRYDCTKPGPAIYYELYPYYWQPNANIYHPGLIALPPYCTPEPKNNHPYIDSTTATTIGKAFSVEGFEADSQTGYSTTLKITWNYGENGYLCGNAPQPGGTLGRGVAIP